MTLIQINPAASTALPQDTRAWIATLVAGQQLSARVLSSTPGGLLRLAVAGHQVTAISALALRTGEQLPLQVLATVPQLTLKLAEPATTGATPATGSAAAALRPGVDAPRPAATLPLQQAVEEPGAALARLLGLLAASSLAAGRTAAGNVANTHLPLAPLADPQSLRTAVLSCGLWLEPLLLRALKGGEVPARDLKAELARLLLNLRGGELAGPAGGERQQLVEALESTLQGITANQLKSLPRDAGQGDAWHILLPFQDQEESRALQMAIHRDPEGDGRETDDESWRISLRLASRLGPLAINLTLKGEGIAVDIKGEQRRGLALLQGSADTLAQRLSAAGLVLNRFSVGVAAVPAAAPEAGVDTHA
ncbi:MAG: flagellar hook-length control protein FliK [Parahaliea sp.]